MSGRPGNTMTFTGNGVDAHNAFDVIDVGQARHEEAGSTGPFVSRRTRLRFFEPVLRRDPAVEIHIAACVDEHRNPAGVRHRADRRDARALRLDGVQALALDDAVFEVDAHHTQVQQARDIVRDGRTVLGVATFGVYRDRHVGHLGDDARGDLRQHIERQLLAIVITLRRCDRPTARGDDARARIADRARAAGIPRVVDEERGIYVRAGS